MGKYRRQMSEGQMSEKVSQSNDERHRQVNIDYLRNSFGFPEIGIRNI